MVVLERGSLSYERGTPVVRHSLGGGACIAAVLAAKGLFLSLKGSPTRATTPPPLSSLMVNMVHISLSRPDSGLGDTLSTGVPRS